MFHRTTRGVVVGALVAVQGLFPTVSQAGPILDWLFGRHNTQYALYCPTTACAPATTACAPVTACSPVAPSPCSPCAQGATSYSPVVGAAQPAAITVAPQTAYRTVQAQVPVTYYRPTTALSPVVGAAAPNVAGCTLVQVQTQRRPVWDILGLFGPREPVSPYPINVQYPTTVGYAPTQVLPSPAATVTTPSYAAPTYSAPAAAAPYYAAPSTGNCPGCATTTPAFPSIPSAPVNPPAATYPAPSSPSGGAATSPAGPEPADQPPSLNAPPQGSYPPSQGNYQGSSYRYTPSAPAATPPSASPQTDPQPQSAPPQTPPQPSRNDLQLIPYPGAEESSPQSGAPPLLNHRGRTASFRRSEPWSYTLISWPESDEVRRASVEQPALPPSAPAPTAPPQLEQWDDSGWRAAR